MHCGFRAGIDKTRHFSARHNPAYHFRQIDLVFCRHAKECPVIKLGTDSFDYRRIAMSKNHRSITHAVVKVDLMIGSSELASERRGRKERIRLVKSTGLLTPPGKIFLPWQRADQISIMYRSLPRAIIIVMLINRKL